MKRPCLALLALLALLASGLTAISPAQAQALTPGELFCAIEIISPPQQHAGDDYCPVCPYADEHAEACPRVCTPTGTPAAEEIHDSVPSTGEVEEAFETAAVTPAVELNAAATSNEPDSDTAWEDEYGQYYGDYYEADDDYSGEYASEYETPAAEAVADEAAAPVIEEEATDTEDDFRYGEGYEYWQPVEESAVSAPGPEDLIVETSDEITAPADVEPYDLYGRQVGDENYGSDFEEGSAPAASDYEDPYEYEYDYDYDYEVETEATDEAASESPAIEETTDETTEAATDTESDWYYEEYYPDYDPEIYNEETEANYGDENAAVGATEAAPAPESVEEDSADEILDELFDVAPTTPAESDLPWADEAPSAAATTPSETADEMVKQESEYGSDYAEDYYGALFGEESADQEEEAAEEELNDEIESQEPNAAEPTFDDAYDFQHDPCHDGECFAPTTTAATLFVVHCGRQIKKWAASLGIVSMRLHSACVQLAELPSPTTTK